MNEQLLNVMKDKGDYPKGLPGPDVILKGDAQLGFFGEMAESALIKYDDLVTAVGMTFGTKPTAAAIAATGLGWVKVAYKENVLYIPKSSVRNTVSWNLLNGIGVVTAAQNKIIEIQGYKFRVRLMNGCNVNPYTGSNNAAGGPQTVGTEWNKIMYGLMADSAGTDLEGPALANMSPTALGLTGVNSTGGSSPIIQEIASGTDGLVRGNASGAYKGLYRHPLTGADFNRGWKPVLEYVPD
uniref:Virion structural protein n=1 Tax=Pseudomonas phage RVTF4 TaxID=3236931 RepID=A0AB39CCN0_9VIRU